MTTQNSNGAGGGSGIVIHKESPAAVAIKNFFGSTDVSNKFRDILGKRSAQFLSSIMQIVNSDEKFLQVNPVSIYNCAVVAAVLDLPLNNNLGFAYIIPYKEQATFQLGYKAYIQFAQRSGQFKTISASPIYEGQLVAENPLTGYEFDFTNKKSEKVIGYAGYFKLLNGFEKTLYMTNEELMDHARKFSQNFKKWGTGLWKDDFAGMATKTVLKLVLSKYAPLSVEMQQAVIVDNTVINDEYGSDVKYYDSPTEKSNAQQNSNSAKINQGANVSNKVGATSSPAAAQRGLLEEETEYDEITESSLCNSDGYYYECRVELTVGSGAKKCIVPPQKPKSYDSVSSSWIYEKIGPDNSPAGNISYSEDELRDYIGINFTKVSPNL